MTNGFRSVVELLDNFFGAAWTAESVDSLSIDELDSLAHDIGDFYDNHVVSPRQSSLRCYSGGATFTANVQQAQNSPVVKLASSQLLPFAHAATLYADEIVVDCPLDAWIYSYRDFPSPQVYWGNSGNIGVTPVAAAGIYGAGFHNSDEQENRARTKAAVEKLYVLAPAIRAGWIIPVPHLRIWKARSQQIIAQTRRDVLDLSMFDVIKGNYASPPAQSDIVRGLTVMPSEGVRPVDCARAVVESPAIYFNSVMAVTDSSDSRFLPTADSDFALLHQRVNDAGKLNRAIRDGLAIGAMRRVLLPSFENFSFATVCDIRRSESSFAAWRDGVRRLADGDDPIRQAELAEREDIMAKRLNEYVVQIRSDAAKSRTLQGKLQSLKPNAIEVAMAMAIWSIPPESSVLKLAASIVAPLVRPAIRSFTSPQGSACSVIIKIGLT